MRLLSTFQDWQNTYPVTSELLAEMLDGANEREKTCAGVSMTGKEPAERETERKLNRALRLALLMAK